MVTSRELVNRCSQLTGKTPAQIIADAVREQAFTNYEDVVEQNIALWQEFLPDYIRDYCQRKIAEAEGGLVVTGPQLTLALGERWRRTQNED